jgi:hypothetical protein
MSRASNLAMALSAALALGACAGEGGLPTSEAPEFQTAGVGPACNLTDLRKATSALFGSKHPANETAKLFTSKNANQSSVTPHAYTLFTFIETKRESGPWLATDPAKGAELTIQIMACTDLIYTDATLSGTGNLGAARTALAAALDFAGTGVYAVGAGTDAVITSKNKEAGLGAPSDFGTWFGGGKSLVIGYVIPSFSPLGYENFADVAYDWSMIRPNGSPGLTGLAKVSYCVDNSFSELELRVQHKAQGQGGVILPVATQVAEVFCNPLASLSPVEPESFAMRLVRSVVDVVRPSPLYAAMLKGPVSGTIGGFSPTAVVDPNDTQMSFAVQPTGGMTNTALPVQVLVRGALGTPWEGVDVRITAAENNGATLAPCGTLATTNANGLAVFPNFQINKPGVVHLTATTVNSDPDLTSYPVDSVVSDNFVVTGAGNEGCQ